MKDEIYEEVKGLVTQFHLAMPKKDRGFIGAYCLYWALTGMRALRRRGVDAQLQAGTAYWPNVRPEQDDGVSCNVFGYEFKATPRVVRQAVEGEMPEMHCWIGVYETQEIIDFTTGYWPEQAKRLADMDWPGDLPPKYLWCKVNELPDGVIYHPFMQAIKLACFMTNTHLVGVG